MDLILGEAQCSYQDVWCMLAWWPYGGMPAWCIESVMRWPYGSLPAWCIESVMRWPYGSMPAWCIESVMHISVWLPRRIWGGWQSCVLRPLDFDTTSKTHLGNIDIQLQKIPYLNFIIFILCLTTIKLMNRNCIGTRCPHPQIFWHQRWPYTDKCIMVECLHSTFSQW